jgi:hypothetical protein
MLFSRLIKDIIVKIFIILHRPIKYIGECLESFLGIITGHHFSLVNVLDRDFCFGTTANQLFNEDNDIKDYNNPDIHDVFHMYLSKLLYEKPDQIIKQCMSWGFNEESISILVSQSDDMTNSPYSTQAVVIDHDESKRLIIAFRGTEPMDLVQWMTDISTNLIDVNNIFNDTNKNDEEIRVHAGFYYALGLNEFYRQESINFDKANLETPIFIRLLDCVQDFHRKHYDCKISITGHSLGGGLASLFSFVLLAYGQPLVGNCPYAEY